MKWQNELTDMLAITYPIVQAPMLGVTTPAMAAAVSNAGGLGSLPVGGLSPDKTISLIRETKKLTSKPFAVNLFTHADTSVSQEQVESMNYFLDKLCAGNSLSLEKPHFGAFDFYSYLRQIEILLNEDVRVVSFTFGILNDDSIRSLKEKNIILIGTATSLKEAGLLDKKGIDIITAQGIEAGGHRGSFLENEPLPMTGTIALVPEIVREIRRPVLAAGGINNGKSIKAAFLLGAAGVQIGTAFLASEESAAIPSYKAAVQNASANDTVLTRAFSGRWARGISNKFIREVENSGIEILPYPGQANLTTRVRMAAQQQDNKDFTALWAGQGVSGIKAKPAAEIFANFIEETEGSTRQSLR